LSSTPGPDHISWRHLKAVAANNVCLEKITLIANACIEFKTWPPQFKAASSIIIPKPNKELYNTPKSFRPIVLLNTTGKLIEKAISNRLQFYLTTNGYLGPNQLSGIRQRSTIDAGLYLTHIVQAGWIKQCHTSIIAFDVAQFFPSLNYLFLTKCLSKTGLKQNIINFFNSYHANQSTTYSWNRFSSPPFNTDIGVGQGSALSPIISAMYMASIIKTFKKRIKNLKEKIPSDILSFVDNGLLISQEKSFELFSAFLLCSYNIMSKVLHDAGLVMEHSKSEVFHFTQSQRPPNQPLDLSSVGGPILTPKPIWRYLGFYFDRKLNFHHMHFYATKCLSTLNAMKLLGNASQGILPIQKRLLYRTCILPIELYGFQLWFFKGAPTAKNMYELGKMQH